MTGSDTHDATVHSSFVNDTGVATDAHLPVGALAQQREWTSEFDRSFSADKKISFVVGDPLVANPDRFFTYEKS